jgi:ATP-dependent RNA helicase DDX47/RRP3
MAEEETKKENEEVTFASLGLVAPLCEACEKLGFKKPTKIQRETLPWALKGPFFKSHN